MLLGAGAGVRNGLSESRDFVKFRYHGNWRSRRLTSYCLTELDESRVVSAVMLEGMKVFVTIIWFVCNLQTLLVIMVFRWGGELMTGLVITDWPLTDC